MRLIQCVTDGNYIIWQLYVQMLNFRKFGYEKDAVILVATKYPSTEFLKFAAWTKAKVYYFEDTRATKDYFSSFRPNLIKQYFKTVEIPPCFFYHDQDIIFRYKVDLDALAKDDYNYVSGTTIVKSYLSVAYLSGFTKHHHLKDMCAIVGIDERVVLLNDEQGNVGGAQAILKNTDYDFWDKMERDCENIYERLRKDTFEDSYNKVYHIQIWTADMWALLYNLYMIGEVRTHPSIGFCWPWESKDNPEPILHNAGIADHNQHLKETGAKAYFNKSLFTGDRCPFDEAHEYIHPDAVQREYIAYFLEAKKAMTMRRFKVLGVFCTTNQINPELLQTVIKRIQIAAENAQECDVEIVTCPWLHIADNPFEETLSFSKAYGHLNYALQIKQVLSKHKSDIVAVLEHDMLYPDNYFDNIVKNWDNTRYGVWNLNYEGINDSGFLNVRQRDAPFSTLAAARFYFDAHMNKKLDEALSRFGTGNASIFIEPELADFKILPYTGEKPCLHVNMNQRGGWGTGSVGKNHHFTNHCEVCYEPDAQGKVIHKDWGHVKNLMPQ
jgi:hypothetical protein